MQVLFETRPWGLRRGDGGWAAWIGRQGRGFHAHVWRSPQHSHNRSFLNLNLSLGQWMLAAFLVRYRTGGKLPWHTDGVRPGRTAAITLKRARQGGDLVFRTPPILQTPRLAVFDERTEHAVTPITGGDRVVLLLQVAKPVPTP